ncbi:MAG: MFS transporter, partial [Anaerolineae bacterium]|nr:MFS transporter [Anaerolineae bacterium]
MDLSALDVFNARKPRYRHLVQRRLSPFDHLHPHRWNWQGLVAPLDHSLEHSAQEPISHEIRLGLRYFWLHGLGNATSDAFFLSYIPLFALAYGASNGQVGWLTAIANLLAAVSLFPGAKAVEWVGKRKPVVTWSFGSTGRLTLLALACVPWFGFDSVAAIIAIIGLNALRAFMDNFANPAWTALVADIVPDGMRARYFSHRNIAMGVVALLFAPLAGWLVTVGNFGQAWPMRGYQVIFLLAFGLGLFSTWSFQRIPEPEANAQVMHKYQRGDLGCAIRKSPGFLGLVISAFVWNMAVQVAAPFFNVYLVNQLGASITTVGWLTAVSGLSALVGQQLFSRLLDRHGALWVQRLAGLLIFWLPLAWIFVTSPWQVVLINACGGLLWAGYNLSNFSLLLQLSPDEQRPRAVALYQTAVFGSAVLGPLIGGFLADVVSFQFIF